MKTFLIIVIIAIIGIGGFMLFGNRSQDNGTQENDETSTENSGEEVAARNGIPEFLVKSQNGKDMCSLIDSVQ